jgi:pimeloyl-ACP methyl ester carboxylesterase
VRPVLHRRRTGRGVASDATAWPPMTSRPGPRLLGMTTTPAQGTYVEVDGLRIYYQQHGEGPPLVLLHGGLQTIEVAFGDVLPALAERHQVVAIELQGHGRTADSDRPLSLERLADDVAQVLTAIGVDRADLLGFSLGGLVAVEFARRHPERAGRLVLASIPTRPEGFHDDVRMPNARPGVGRMPTEDDFQAWEQAYRAVAPDPDHFADFAAKLGPFVASLPGWSDDELRELTGPTLVLIGDNDFVRVEHAAHMQEVLPDARLAVVPGVTHVGLLHEPDLVLPILHRFLTS